MWRACVLQVGLCATAVVDARGYLGATARGEPDLAHRPSVAQAGSAPGSEEGYRLGDCFFNKMGMRQGPFGEGFHRAKWPESLAVAYMRRTNASGDYSVFTDLVRQRGVDVPASSLVVHLRTGDVLDQAGLPLQAFLDHHQPLCWQRDVREVGLVYAQPLRYFETLDVPPAVSEVVIVASTRYHAPYEAAAGQDQSRRYVAAVAQVFQRMGYRVTERLNGDADEAFLYCAKARYFVPSGGGFSTMAAKVVERLGGRVLGTPVTFIGPSNALRLCLYQGLSLSSLVWSTFRTAGKIVFVEHLRVLPVFARASLLLLLGGYAALWLLQMARARGLLDGLHRPRQCLWVDALCGSTK